MGYIITFKYSEQDPSTEDAIQEESSLKEKIVEIGSYEEDTDPRKVAATIIKQYGDPNIWIQDVVVEQWTRTKLKFSQTKNGVKIGNQTFNLGLNEIMKLAQDNNSQCEQPPPQQIVYPTPQQIPQYAPQMPQYQQPQYSPPQHQTLPQPQRYLHPHEIAYQNQRAYQPQNEAVQQTYANSTQQAYPVNPNDGQFKTTAVGPTQVTPSGKKLQPTLYAQRQEVLDPPPELRGELRNMNLTLGRKYLIISEHNAPGTASGIPGMVYKLQDDTGKEVVVRSHFFRPEQKLLVSQSYIAPDGTLRDHTSFGTYDAPNDGPRPQLLFDNNSSDYSPAIRQPAMYGQSNTAPAGRQMNDVMSKVDQAIADSKRNRR